MTSAGGAGPETTGPQSAPRRAALLGAALLAAALAVQLWSGPGDGAPWRRAWFDGLQQAMPRERISDPAVVVAIDDDSLGRIGQWPWPRHYVAELIRRIDAAGAEAIGIDVIFAEADRLSPGAILSWIGLQDPQAIAALQALGDTDVALAEAIRQAPVALAAAGVRADGPAAEHPGIGPRVILKGVEAEALPGFDHGLGPIALFRPVAAGFGAISHAPSPDGVLRRVSLVQRIVGRPYLLLGAETRRIAGAAAAARVTPEAFGLRVDLGDAALPAEANGDFWLHMGRLDPARYVSAIDILTGDPAALAKLQGRIALVAVTGLGTLDLQTTPLRQAVYGVEAHLQLIEQIADRRFLRRPAAVFWAELALTLAFGLAVIRIVPRAAPGRSMPALAGAALLLGGLSALAFRQGLLVDAASPALAGGLIGVAMTALTLVERDRARLVAEIALERARADGARIEAELAAAWKIQQGLLPPVSRRIEDRLDLACHIAPARQVGGDFYDHFMIDAQRLFFMVGDVSGKGVEASVFMGLSKALWKSAALRGDQSLERVQKVANEEISRDNPDMMFATGFVGILDLETGELRHSSAGHEPPFIFSPDGTVRRLAECSGPPVGLDPDAEFPVGLDRLAPGEGICVFSDGLTEAENTARALYGVDRAAAVLAGLGPSPTAREAVEALCADVARFAGDAPPSDDLTLLVALRPA